MAVPPPTLALAPGIAPTVVLIRSTSVYAAGLSGGMVIVACRKDRPSLVTGGVTEAMPGVAASAVLTCPALVGEPVNSSGVRRRVRVRDRRGGRCRRCRGLPGGGPPGSRGVRLQVCGG